MSRCLKVQNSSLLTGGNTALNSVIKKACKFLKIFFLVFVLCMSVDYSTQALSLFHLKVASQVLFIMVTSICNGNGVLQE